MSFRLLSLIVVFVAFSVSAADAKKRHYNPSQQATFGSGCVQNNDGRTICMGAPESRPAAPMGRRHIAPSNGYDIASVTYLPHPSGCPSRAFCGCGARKHLGIDDVRLNLAANWLRYYTGSTRVAVWRGHVAVIDRMTGPTTAMLYDFNSGGHLSRYHERDISRARIVGGGMAHL